MRAEENPFPHVTLDEQGSTPSTPASGLWRLYAAADGIHAVDDGGTDIGPFGAAGGSLGHTTLGTTSQGGSTSGTRLFYAKKVTLASAGFLGSIHAWLKGDGSNAAAAFAALVEDNAGSPRNVLAIAPPSLTTSPTNVHGVILNTTYRDVSFAIGRWLAAGDYWIGVQLQCNGGDNRINIAYAGSGSDKTQPNNFPVDSSISAYSGTSNDYSIYADVLT